MPEQIEFKHCDVAALGEDIPNLDAFNDPDDFCQLKTELEAIAETFKQLANYAEAKGGAAEFRLRGGIAVAKHYEDAAETVYKRLPQWARW